jgi:hypothetical protein
MKSNSRCGLRYGRVLLMLAIGCQTAHGAGLWCYEMGTPDVGTASAGMASRASDAGSAPVNQTGGVLRGDLKGRFKDDAFSIVALNMNWKF